MIFENIIQTVGNTPIVHLSNMFKSDLNVFAKIESFNPLSSVKDRLAKALIEDAIQSKRITTKDTIVEPTSGNTGIGLAFVGKSLGIKVTLVMPESASIERRKIMSALGAELVLTPAKDGMKGAISTANQLVEDKKYIMLNQFENPANPRMHKETTGPEIWEQMGGDIDYLVAGVGTGGTITGVGEYLKSKNQNIKIFAVEPSESSVLSGNQPGPHKIQGIGAGFVPKVLNREIINRIITVSFEEAQAECLKLINLEGIFAGVSSGAVLAAIRKLENTSEIENKNIVVILPDSGERYLSTGIFE